MQDLIKCVPFQYVHQNVVGNKTALNMGSILIKPISIRSALA